MIPRFIILVLLLVFTIIGSIIIALFISKDAGQRFMNSIDLNHILGEG